MLYLYVRGLYHNSSSLHYSNAQISNHLCQQTTCDACTLIAVQVWTAERSTQLGMAVSSMLKGYTTTAAQIITAMLKSVTKFTIQVGSMSYQCLAECASSK